MLHLLLSQVMESEEFMLLPANQLIDIISSDELNVRSEEQVFNAVMAWVKYSIQERRPQLPQVCKTEQRSQHRFGYRCFFCKFIAFLPLLSILVQ